MALKTAAKAEIVKFIEGCAERLNAAAVAKDDEDHERACKVLEALAMVLADGDEEYAEAIIMAMVEYDIAYIVEQDRDVLVDYHLNGGDAAPEDSKPQSGYCRHGNRVGSAPGGEHICGECEGD